MATAGKPEGVRRTKRQAVFDLFSTNLGVRFASNHLHSIFGSAVRTRISELNADPNCPIEIFNALTFQDGGECSTYWAQRRTPAGETMPMFSGSELAGGMEHRDLG